MRKFAVIGLGNPGPSYRETRHNIGFMVVDRLAASHGIRVDRAGGSFIWGDGSIRKERVVLAKPNTFMNLSGEAARDILGYFAIPAESMFVVCDDCDLPPGRIRIRKNGGSGGHRGLASIIERIGGVRFPRLRMGIGRDAEKSLEDYVLSPFLSAEMELVREEIERGVSALEAVMERGLDWAMNRYNR
ncbi:MAG: aminoacyl-tRNA hydrolase [Deltaproteobacteria bacterium]|nr:aminoacyl-tRNA hydrolase [Deltaproteobacteria bacterium]